MRTRSGPSAACVRWGPLATLTTGCAPPTRCSAAGTGTADPTRSVWSPASASAPRHSSLTPPMVASVRAHAKDSSAVSTLTAPPPIRPSACVRPAMVVTQSEDVLMWMNVSVIHVDPVPGIELLLLHLQCASINYHEQRRLLEGKYRFNILFLLKILFRGGILQVKLK